MKQIPFINIEEVSSWKHGFCYTPWQQEQNPAEQVRSFNDLNQL